MGCILFEEGNRQCCQDGSKLERTDRLTRARLRYHYWSSSFTQLFRPATAHIEILCFCFVLFWQLFQPLIPFLKCTGIHNVPMCWEPYVKTTSEHYHQRCFVWYVVIIHCGLLWSMSHCKCSVQYKCESWYSIILVVMVVITITIVIIIIIIIIIIIP